MNVFRPILLLLLFTVPAQAQTIFTDDFVGDFPAALLSIDGYLYVGTLETGTPQRISRIEIENPKNIEFVSDFESAPGFGVWKMAYNQAENEIYAYDVFFYRVDLDQSLPIDKELLFGEGNACSDGIAQKDGIIYLACSDSIDRLDATQVDPTIEEVIDLSSFGTPRNPAVFGNELYFSVSDNGDSDLYKIDLADPANTLELVSNLDQNSGGVQSALVADNFLYLGVEGTPHRVLKLDLSNTNYPIAEEVLIDNFSGGPIGLARNGNTIYLTDGNTQNIFQFTDNELSVDQAETNKIEIYPVPANDLLFVRGLETDSPYVIYNTTGAQVRSGRTSNGQIAIQSLNTGLYFLQLRGARQNFNLRFVKE